MFMRVLRKSKAVYEVAAAMAVEWCGGAVVVVVPSGDGAAVVWQRGCGEEFLSLPVNVESAQDKLMTLDALPSLLLNVTKALNKFVEVLESTSTKAGDHSVPLDGQEDIILVEGERDTNQATIS
nr:hypothetical protein [Tanacetum cinerariifolium]